MNLTAEQQKAVEFINNNSGVILLNGSAGTGKTSCLFGLGNNVTFTATTHQAADVLAKKVAKATATVHSHLSLKIKENRMQRVLVQQGLPKPAINLVIDEASMIGKDLMPYVENYSKNCKIILVGDDKQLPPVGEKISPIFTAGYPTFTLHEVRRQSSENDNSQLFLDIPRVLKRKDGINYKYVSDIPIEMLVDANGTDKCKYLCWTNNTVSKVNDKVRAALYGKNAPEYIEGEYLKFTDMYDGIGGYTVQNNSEIKVETIEGAEMFGMGCWLINGKILILPKSVELVWKRKMDMIIKEAKASNNWNKYWVAKGTFAPVQYNHAYTVHRSQGSTYDNSIIDLKEISRNPDSSEMTKMIYTAITRTANNNYFI